MRLKLYDVTFIIVIYSQEKLVVYLDTRNTELMILFKATQLVSVNISHHTGLITLTRGSSVTSLHSHAGYTMEEKLITPQ